MSMEIFRFLQNIQDDMMVVIVLTLVGAIFFITITVIHEVMQVLEQYIECRGKQRKAMQEFYLVFQAYLLELKLIIEEIERCSVSYYIDTDQAIAEYLEYEREQKGSWVQPHIWAMRDFTKKAADIHGCFLKYAVPKVSVLHPVLKRRVKRMLMVLLYDSVLWEQYRQGKVRDEAFQKEITGSHKKWGMKMDRMGIERYLVWLDEWFVKY